MSRIGRLPVEIPQNIKVKVDGYKIQVEGPKGKLQMDFHSRLEVIVEKGSLLVKRPTDEPKDRSLHGTTRTLISNMIKGVSQEFVKELQIEGVGYRAQMKGKILNLSLGYSHPVDYPIPEGILVEVSKKQDEITIKGIDKQKVGQVAAEIRGFRPPEPYKGKGIRYKGEHIRRKQGKSVA